MSHNKKTVFSELWLDPHFYPEFVPWLHKNPKSTHEAFCNGCKTIIHLSNMGRQAISSHAQSAKHVKYINSLTNRQGNLKSFLQPPVCQTGSQASTSSVTAASSLPSHIVSAVTSQPIASVTTRQSDVSAETTASVSANEGTPKVVSVYGFVANDQVTKAEIVWVMKTVMSHFSMNSSKDMKDIFQLMFPDSDIAKKITVGSTKIAYMITYGLAPYYHNQLVQSVQKCDRFVICFDEAMNRISQRGQMDIVIRYWDSERNEVSCRYFGSAFMGHASAECILYSFKEALKEVSLSCLLHVSMDGPAVNWKFLDLLSKNLSWSLSSGKSGKVREFEMGF
jgi:hypothetical protein